MKYLFFIFFSLVEISLLKAQVKELSAILLKGTIHISEDALPNGNVFVLQPKDSSFINGVFFMDGKFEIGSSIVPPLLLQFTSLEFADTIISINQKPVNDTLHISDILLQPTNWDLATATVKANRPAYLHQTNGTVSVTINNTVLATNSSINELLSNLPEIRIDEEGNLSIIGKGTAIIFLDGQRVLSSQVAAILPSNIQFIEIIRNPSARYDSEGSAVIHIHTKNGRQDGKQIQISKNIQYTQGVGIKMTPNIKVHSLKKKWRLQGFYNFQHGNDNWLQITTRERLSPSSFFSSEVTTRWQTRILNDSHFGFGLQHQITPNSYWSFNSYGQFRKIGGSITVQNILEDQIGKVVFNNLTSPLINEQNYVGSFNYQQELDSNGSLIFLGIQHNQFSSQGSNEIKESQNESGISSFRDILNKEYRNIQIKTIQLDWTKVIPNYFQLETGVKGSLINNQSNNDFLIQTDWLNFEKDPQQSNAFQYKEQVAAAYMSVSGKLLSSLQYIIGLRTEYTNYKITLLNSPQPISDKYLAWFPNFSLSYLLNKDYRIDWTYRASINRQPYENLNPSLVYQDPYTSIQGNPFLIPERLHSFEANVQLKRLQLRTGYIYTLNPLNAAALRGEVERSYILKKINYENQHRWYIAASRSLSWRWWTSESTVSATYTRSRSEEFGISAGSPRINWYAYSSQSFQVLNNWKTTVIFWWQSDLYDGTDHREESWNLSFSITRSFFQDRLNCTLLINDLFHTNRADGDYRAAETDITFLNKWNSNYIRFIVSTKIGKLKPSQTAHKNTGEDEVNRK